MIIKVQNRQRQTFTVHEVSEEAFMCSPPLPPTARQKHLIKQIPVTWLPSAQFRVHRDLFLHRSLQMERVMIPLGTSTISNAYEVTDPLKLNTEKFSQTEKMF